MINALTRLRQLLDAFDKPCASGTHREGPEHAKDDEEFDFDKYECSLLMNGICPVESWSDAELEEGVDPYVHRYEYEEPYCAYLAWRLISGDQRYLAHGPADGRHRECAARKLRKRGYSVRLKVE